MRVSSRRGRRDSRSRRDGSANAGRRVLDVCCFGEYGVVGVGGLPEVVGENYLVEGAGNVGLRIVDGRSGLLDAVVIA